MIWCIIDHYFTSQKQPLRFLTEGRMT